MAADETVPGLDSSAAAEPPYLHVLSAFLALEPVDSVISLARECNGGLISGNIQRFFWENCLKAVANGNASYVKKFLKKLINEVELENSEVLDEVYEEYALYMCSSKDDKMIKENIRVNKVFSFLFPEGSYRHLSCPNTRKLAVPLQCSLNMLEGDTGCSIWPSSLFLSEFVLSFPDIFSGRSCFEVGSGVGLVGICLAHVKASKIILTDGDLLTLANMKLNLEMNGLSYDTDLPEQSTVKCIHLPWETASEGELGDYNPDIILGADVIYDPSCLPHLVRVLSTLLRKQAWRSKRRDDFADPINAVAEKHSDGEDTNTGERYSPVAYIASVIRNIDTFNVFLALLDQADLSITDITEKLKLFDFLPYMRSYDRSSIRLFSVSSR